MLAQKVILSYSSRLSVQIVQIIATIIVARIAGPGVLGTVAFGVAYVSVFSFIADLGFGTAFIKKLSEGRDEAKCIGTFAWIKSALVTAYVLFVIGFFLLQKNVFHVSFESPAHVQVIFISLAAAALAQELMIVKSTFAAYTQQAKSDIPVLLETLVHQALRIIFVLLGFRAVALAFGDLIAGIVIVPLYLYLFRSFKVGPFDRNIAKEYLKIGWPLIVIGITSKFYSDIDKVLLQFYTNSEQVGYYTAGFRIGGFVLLISNSISTLFFPIFSKAAVRNEFETIKRYIDTFERFSYVYIMPFLILVSLFSKEIILTLVGKRYLPSVPIMTIVNIAMFIRVTNTPYSSVIVGLGKFLQTLIISVVHFAFYGVVLILCIHPKFLNMSGKGAAIATLAGNILMLILYRLYTKKYMPILSNKPTILYSIYGIVNYALAYLVLNGTELFRGYKKPVFLVFYIVATFYSMVLLKLADRSDLKYFRILIDYRAMSRYIKTEVKGKL